MVFGWTRALRGPRFITSHGMKAPNWAGVKRFTSNIATGLLRLLVNVFEDANMRLEVVFRVFRFFRAEKF